MDLEAEFKKLIKEKNLFPQSAIALLAVSGGIDSVVMAELFHRCGYTFNIAHCNFKLRSRESDKDEQFVKGLARKYKVPFYSQRFDTKDFAAKNKLSIQEAARQLRYSWILEQLQDNNLHYAATAHHFNDSVETFFINLLRGTGLAGLQGIAYQRRIELNRGASLNLKDNQFHIVRPLLFAKREDIEEFAKKKKINFREDSSNKTDNYLRNRVRHHLIPMLLKLNPQFEKVMWRNMQRFAFAEDIFSNKMRQEFLNLIDFSSDSNYISRKDLEQRKYPIEYLAEALKAFGFNYAQSIDIWNSKQSGKKFFSSGYRITVDRKKFFINPIESEDKEEVMLDKKAKEMKHPDFILRINSYSKKKGKVSQLPVKVNIHSLDAGKLEFPLTVRKWEKGDSFFPLGMSHHKKVSDFLIDKKIPLPQKEKTFVVISGNEIACILGQRIDDRFKINEETKKIYSIEYICN